MPKYKRVGKYLNQIVYNDIDPYMDNDTPAQAPSTSYKLQILSYQ